jgi:DNA/RNA-binding domain of Phe-tRNA-synthetase-like protein
MSNVSEIQFAVEKSVLDIGVKIVFLVIEGIDNTRISPEWMEKRKGIIANLLNDYKDIDYHADPVLEGFHILHDRAGVKRRKNIPASENLIRFLNKHGDVFFINQAVDIYNIISMKSKLALGAHDIDRVDGNVTLRFTDGTERFVPIGQSEPVSNNPHEYSYCDDANEVLCRLEIRQVEKTKVDEKTTNAFYIIQGNEATDNELLLATARKILDETIKYCGGKGRIIIPTRRT